MLAVKDGSDADLKTARVPAGGDRFRANAVQSPSRGVWAHPVTRIGWEDDDWSELEAARDGSQQERL